MQETGGPGLTVKDEDILLILEAVVLLLPVHILETVNGTIVDYPLLIPKTFSYGRVLLIHVFDVKLVIFFVF